MQAASSFAVLMVTGANTLALKYIQRGDDPLKCGRELNDPKKSSKTGVDLFDRHLSLCADAAIKMSGLSGSTRYHRNDALQSILGVNAGLIGAT
jgi:hypothetical protein